MNSFTRKLLILIVSIAYITFASDASSWMRHPDISEVDEEKTGTIMTFYWTFDPDNADPGWDGWTKGDAPQDPVHLQGTDITMPRNMAEKFNLEGSGWYTEDGGHRVINIIEPHADPELTLFKEVPFVDYGLDAPHYHFGLVPFRTVAGVHDDIPAGTWVYIPMFEDIEVPVYDLNDRTQVDYTFWHDGWFRVSDISWSFANDETQIDIFGGTVQAVAEVYNKIWWNFEKTGIWNETKGEYQELDTYQGRVSFFYRADVPIYSLSEGNAVYRYAQTVDTVHNDTKPQLFKFASNMGSDIKVIPLDIDNDKLRDDVVLYFKDQKILKAYKDFNEISITSATASLWQKSLASTSIYDLKVGDYNSDKKDDLIYVTNDGIYAMTSLNSNPVVKTLSSKVVSKFEIGDIDNDNINEIVVFDGTSFSWAEFGTVEFNSFSNITSINNSGISAITLGDIEGKGQDDIIFGTNSGVYKYSFTSNSTALIASDITSPTDLKACYIDPDGYVDIYAVANGNVLAKFSSHKADADFVNIGKTNSDWVNIGTIDPRTVNYSFGVPIVNTYQHTVANYLKVKRDSAILPYNGKMSDLKVYSVSGKILAKISPIKKSGNLVYSLESLKNISKQPLFFSIKQGNKKISKMVMF